MKAELRPHALLTMKSEESQPISEISRRPPHAAVRTLTAHATQSNPRAMHFVIVLLSRVRIDEGHIGFWLATAR